MIQHLWIIMDGNRRWAKRQWKFALFWHKAGFDNAVHISQIVANIWIPYLTLWALSTENLQKREKEELSWIIGLIELLPTLIPIFQKNKTRFETIGDIKKLPLRTQNILESIKEATKENSEKTLIIALVYGWQDEIIRWVQSFAQAGNDIQNLSPETLRPFLDTGKYPSPELIIRTGGDIRHSWFLLFESAYSEYYFTEKLWPEFDESELKKAIDFFEHTKRNFGK